MIVGAKWTLLGTHWTTSAERVANTKSMARHRDKAKDVMAKNITYSIYLMLTNPERSITYLWKK